MNLYFGKGSRSAIEATPGFDFKGTRKGLVNTNENIEMLAYRLFWDARRPPLFGGVEEPLSPKPILIHPNGIDYSLLVIEVVIPGEAPDFAVWQVTTARLVAMTLGQFEFAPGSKIVPSFFGEQVAAI